MPDNNKETAIVDLNDQPEKNIKPPTIEEVKALLFTTKKEDVVALAGAFFSSTAISRTRTWHDVLANDPTTTMFFVAGTFRVILAMRKMLFKEVDKDATDNEIIQ